MKVLKEKLADQKKCLVLLLPCLSKAIKLVASPQTQVLKFKSIINNEINIWNNDNDLTHNKMKEIAFKGKIHWFSTDYGLNGIKD